MKQPRKTPTKEQKEWLKQSGYTENDMDQFWKDNIDTNFIIRNLNNCGMTWRDMNISCVMNLPTQKERDAKALEEKRRLEEAQKAEKLREQQELDYYNTHFEEIVINKIDNNELLSERELRELVSEFSVDSECGDNRRWTRTVTTIVELCGRFFSIDWEEGLTECQENEFNSQPIEVYKNTYEKTITVTEWRPVKRC